MLYFLNFSVPINKSGIEHAQLKRLQLFKDNNVEAKIVTRDYDANLHYNIKVSKMDDSDVINMFDYFQGAVHFDRKPVGVDEIQIAKNLADDVTRKWDDANNYYELFNGDKIIMRIVLFKDSEQVSAVHYFDHLENLYRVDYYDYRGFISKRQYYTPDNNVNMEELLRPDGTVALRQFFRFDRSMQRSLSQYRLIGYHGKDYQFDTISMLMRFFLDELNKKDPQTGIFISDRSLVDDWSIMHMETPSYKVLHLHNSQTNDANDPLHSGLNYNYELGLNNLDKWDAIITSTMKQAKDVQKRFNPGIPIYAIPVGIVPEAVLEEDRIPVSERTRHKVIAVARISHEKHLDDLVRAVNQARESVPDISLDIYGYENDENDYAEPKKVKAAIKELGLEDVVKLQGYSTDLDSVYKSAQVFGLTSRMEGFNLSLLEAISHGVVGVTYDVNYGPNSIVEDGVNGNIVEFNNWHQVADRLVKLFKNDELLQKYSDGAYETAKQYSPENVWNAWVNLIVDANNKIAQD